MGYNFRMMTTAVAMIAGVLYFLFTGVVDWESISMSVAAIIGILAGMRTLPDVDPGIKKRIRKQNEDKLILEDRPLWNEEDIVKPNTAYRGKH